MTEFNFPVDEDYARKHNEFFRDSRQTQISAGVLAALLILAIVILNLVVKHSTITLLASVALGGFAVLCLLVIPFLPKAMGSPQQYYDMYALTPAVVAQVNARDVVLLALVDANVNAPSVRNGRFLSPALVTRVVTSIPGVPREVGGRVPSMAVTGVRTLKSRDQFEEISPMPVAWGTPDESVWSSAERAIPTSQWEELEANLGRCDEVLATKRNILPLD